MKKTAGFTLIEVLLALFIMVSTVTILSNVQMRAVRRVLQDREETERMFLAKKEWYQLYLNPPKEEKTTKNEIEKPEIKFVNEIKKLTRKLSSSTKKTDEKKSKDADPTLRLITTIGTWKSNDFKNSITLTGVIYQALEQEKKK